MNSYQSRIYEPKNAIASALAIFPNHKKAVNYPISKSDILLIQY